MKKAVIFCGASGTGYNFQQADTQKPWSHQAGIAVFAAPAAYGWRVIRVIDLTGRDHDLRPIWALHDAQRYGASCVFLSPGQDSAARQAIIDDLERGLSPVVCGQGAGFALAA